MVIRNDLVTSENRWYTNIYLSRLIWSVIIDCQLLEFTESVQIETFAIDYG